MSWPADLDESLLTTTLVGTTLELPSATPELVDALRHDREVLVRDAMLWQRWVRYIALIALALLALIFGAGPRTVMLQGIVLTSVAYLACVAITAELIRRAEVIHEHRLPALLVTADIAALSMLVWLSGSPAEMGRILIGASLVVQLAVFYFGRRLGTYAALLASLAYLCTTYVSPNSVTLRPLLPHLLYSLGVFGMVSTVVITAYGNFRERMNRLRLFCKLVEDGDITPSFALGVDKRPDDLTLLARSFEAMRSRLAEQIGTDPLTGCLNRRALESRLRAEWRQATRRSSTLAVLAIDMDHFKQINDTRGHPFGDVVLQELAGIMKATARDTDAVARLGGDEFVIVLPDTGWEGALTFAERLRRKVDEFAFGEDTEVIRLTVSVGVALARGNDPNSPETLLQEADRSLYKAKSGGRNRVFA
ncbi:MAG: GGDEF domain-containing protein [Gemmatimonadota bacterium]|nr:GGDEF domain-containing protein [Gemmatimonadota bacterium]